MQDLLVQVTLGHKSGFAEDAFVNTLAVQMPDAWAPSLDMLDLSGPVANIYKQTQASTKSIGHFLGYGVTRAAAGCSIRVYDIAPVLGGGPHGSPIGVDTFTMSAGDNSDSLPEEVALVASLRAGGWGDEPIEAPDGADPGTAIDRPRQRFSGRMYFGPFTTSALTIDAAFKPRPATLLVTTILDALEGFNTAIQASGGRFCVWSRRDAVLRPLDGPGFDPGAVQVDNAFDTQRKRGTDSTVRTQRTL